MIDKSSLAGTFIIVSRLLQFYLAPVVSLSEGQMTPLESPSDTLIRSHPYSTKHSVTIALRWFCACHAHEGISKFSSSVTSVLICEMSEKKHQILTETQMFTHFIDVVIIL